MSLESFANNNNLEKTAENNNLNQSQSHKVMEELRAAKLSGDKNRIEVTQKKADDIYRVKRRITNLTDFVPVVGSAKMLAEAFKGEQYVTGQKIEGWKRGLHGVTGAAFLAADLTGVGAVGSLIGKGALKGGIKIGEKMAEKAILESGGKVVVKITEQEAAILAQRQLLKKEGTKLVARADKRIDRAENIENADINNS